MHTHSPLDGAVIPAENDNSSGKPDDTSDGKPGEEWQQDHEYRYAI